MFWSYKVSWLDISDTVVGLWVEMEEILYQVVVVNILYYLQLYLFAIPHQNINPLENIDLSYKHNQSYI